MTEYEYALRTVTVASGQAFEISHAVAPVTLVALCGTVAVPEPGSRWADSEPGSRCEACERLINGPEVVEPEVVKREVVEPESTLEPEPPVAAEAGPSAGERVRDAVGRVLERWRGLGRRVRLGIAAAVLVLVAVMVVVLLIGGGFRADPTSAAYKNGYAYGHDLMSLSDDIVGSCTQATVDDPRSTAGKNFIAGCQAGFAARTP